MANYNERQRRDQYRTGNDQVRRNFRYEDEITNDDSYDAYRYPIDREDHDQISDRYEGTARSSAQWTRNRERFDPDRYNPNGGRFGHQNQRTSFGESNYGEPRRDDRFNNLSGSGKSYGTNNDLKRDFDRGMGYANYGSSEGAGDNLGYQLDENNRTGESSWMGSERRTGLHRGKGPRGYQRSDERIKEDINDRLSDDPFVDASDIEVSVEKGEVTLSGKVEERQEKRKAEEIAEAVYGVINVENRIRIGRGLSFGRSRDEDGSANLGNGSSINGGMK